jgi:hypothetical protein
MTSISTNPAPGAVGTNTLQSDPTAKQLTGLDALRAQPSFTFKGADDFQTHVGAPPGSPLLGINPLIPDSMENWWYGRTSLGDAGAYVQKDGFFYFYDNKGDFVGKFKEVREGEHTRTITVNSGGSASLTIAGQGASVGGDGSSLTVFLAPAK